MIKKLLSVILAAGLLISCLVLPAVAADDEVTADNAYASLTYKDGTLKYFASIGDAISTLNSDTGEDSITLTLMKDTSFANADRFTISRDNVTLDGQNCSLECSNLGTYNFAFTVSGANFTIEDIKFNLSNGGAIKLTGSGNALISNVTVTIPDTQTTAGGPGIAIAGSSDGTLNVTINNTKVRTTNRSLQFSGAGNTVNVEINGGSFVNTKGTGKCIDFGTGTATEKIASNTTVTVNGGHFETLSTAVFRVWGGELVLNGGTFFTNGSGDVILGSDYSATSGGKITVNGGVYITKNSKADKLAAIYSAGGSVEVKEATIINIGTAEHKAVLDNGNGSGQDISFGGNSYVVIKDGAVSASALPTKEAGAQVRLVESDPGLRFISEISASALADAETVKTQLEALNATGTAKVSYGTIIAPKSLVETAGELTHKSVTADNLLDIPGVLGAGVTGDESGNLTLRAAVVGFPEDKAAYTLELAARAYIKIEAGGYTLYIYSDYSVENDVRSIYGVAKMALDDTSANYSESQLAILSKYVNTVEG